MLFVWWPELLRASSLAISWQMSLRHLAAAVGFSIGICLLLGMGEKNTGTGSIKPSVRLGWLLAPLNVVHGQANVFRDLFRVLKRL